MELAHYTWSWYAAPPLVVGVLTFLLGCAVLIRERGTFVSAAFWLMTMAATVWLESYVGIFCARDAAVALWWAKAEHLGVVFIPSTVFLFTLAVVQRIRPWQWLGTVGLLGSALFALAVLATDGLVAGLYRYPWGWYPRYGPLGAAFLVFFFGLMVTSFRLYWVERRWRRSEIHRRRLHELFRGFCVAYLGSVDYLAVYGIAVYPFGYLPIFVFLGLAARAIWRYRLVDITPAFAAQQIITTMGDAVLVIDCEGVIRVVNQAACRLFERPQWELIGHSISTVDPRFLGAQDLGTIIRAGAATRYETSYPTRLRGMVALDISIAALPDRAGQVVGAVCIARDVTERQRAEQAIQESKAYAESIVDTVREPLVVLDAARRVKAANRAFYEMFQVAPEEARHRRLDEMGQGRWNVSKLRGMLRLLPKEAPFHDVEVEYEFPGDGVRIFLLNARRLHRQGSQPELILLAMDDITERKQAEEQLKVVIAELEASQEALRAAQARRDPPPVT